MKSLAAIRARLDELLAAHGEENERPSAVVVLPDDGRGPDADVRPWPRVNRVGRAAVITYRVEDGEPSPEAIRALIDSTVRS